MSVYEVQFKIGDSSDVGPMAWRDGMVINVLPPGEFFTLKEVMSWIGDHNTGITGEPPEGFLKLHLEKQRQLTRRIKQINYLLKPKLKSKNKEAILEARQRAFGDMPKLPVDLKEQIQSINTWINEAQQNMEMIIAMNGIDTNWGLGDLSSHGVICIDMDPNLVDHLMQGPTDEDVDFLGRREEWARREWRVKYEEFLTEQEILDTRNPDVLIHINREKIYIPNHALERIEKHKT